MFMAPGPDQQDGSRGDPAADVTVTVGKDFVATVELRRPPAN